MSLILEALRKSEAERRRAQVPDLLAEPQVVATRTISAPQRWPWIAGGAVVVAMGLWFATTRDAATPAVASAGVDEDAASQPAPVEHSAPAAARPAPALQRPLVVAPPAPQPASQPAPRPAVPPTIAPASMPASAAPQPALPAPTTPTRVASIPPTLPAAPDYERIADLGSEDRKQLPPLKLSMHMWNDVAAQRFVIIDGARLGVGDRLGAVIVADIVPDGVVLDWNGRALKLPLR